MMDLIKKKRGSILVSLLFIGYFFFLWLVLNPSLYLIRNFREFFTDGSFLRDFTDFPGNPADYVSRLLTQFYNIPILASLIITGMLLLVYWLGTRLFDRKGNHTALPFLPVLLLMVMHNDYGHSIQFDLDILALLLAVFAYLGIGNKSAWIKLLMYPLLLALVLYLNGSVTALLFIVLVFASVLILQESKMQLLWLLLETLAVYFLFSFLVDLSYHDLNQEVNDILRVYTFHFLPFALYLSVILAFVSGAFLVARQKYVLSAVCVLMTVVVLVTFSFEEKKELSVKHYALNQKWDKVLEYSKKCNYADKVVACYTNEALYHTGRFYTEFFQYNQAFGSEGLFATEISNYSEIVPTQQIFLDMSAFSLSVIWGTEATNVYGANPYVLKNMTKAYLAEGCYKEAQKMLNLLDKSLFNKKWVRDYQKFVDDTALIYTDPELGKLKRAQLPASVISTTSREMNLYLMSRTSSNNKMAFDYLLISTLLDNRMKDFATCLSGLEVFGYTAIPRLYFEGLMYYSLYSTQSPIDIQNLTYDNNIIRQFREFRKAYSALKNNPVEARKQLMPKYGDTYWFYILFDSPVSEDERMDISARFAL